ncbi:MAG TPA: hypothetical protein VEW28_06180 [Candidatus Kapabacteria bacterium]|nr:hypothetical protein [Candidatus Kapabacteria bacterium]
MPGTISRRLVGITMLFVTSISSYAQHTKYDFSASFAYGGQDPFITSGSARYFSKPTIWNIRCQVATNFVQSVSIVLEHAVETRSREGLWNLGTTLSSAYNANISESLSMTSLYVEMIRTIVRTDIFRIGIGADLGYGFGGATANVKRINDHSTTSYDNDSPWTSFFLGALIRARLTIVDTDDLDIGLTATGRYWALPTLGPISHSAGVYNGPDIASTHEIGYLAGVSVGIKK